MAAQGLELDVSRFNPFWKPPTPAAAPAKEENIVRIDDVSLLAPIFGDRSRGIAPGGGPMAKAES